MTALHHASTFLPAYLVTSAATMYASSACVRMCVCASVLLVMYTKFTCPGTRLP